ncbi:LOW QUALITY PROTEIN: leukocyte elastase inhibitor A-like [Penaeus monodon]|uniref:LOW QUALITY PROTEIN: leukocyte elastase inhibitor A-like n=1 Tax=Penaeus monodon TaxID=6687 RepID=UPI0018A7B4AC|nr:LOW QUALITY PROTEIN: leukocyte elastase inhibitor A-like [Penaeus monodon]
MHIIRGPALSCYFEVERETHRTMRSLVLATALSLSFGLVSPQCISKDDSLVPPPRTYLGHIAPFSVGLLKEVLPASGNFFFSPYSIWTALTLAYFGSNGSTKTQLERVLQLGNREGALALYKSVDNRYRLQENNPNNTINAANRIYVQDGLPLRECLQTVFSKEMKAVDFRQQAQAAAGEINRFVSDTTRGKIPEIVSANSVSGAVMVLVNAVYFKGLWERQFKVENTAPQRFFVTPNRHAMVPMMSQESGFKYGESQELDAQVLEMPYRSGRTSMFVLLPRDQGTGRELDEMVQRLNPSTLTAALTDTHEQTVHLKFPKFKFEKKIDSALQQALVRMGVADLFSDRADLTNFKSDGGLQATGIIHKAVVEVDEEGAEAAAATAIIVTFSAIAIPPPPVRFTCDRPFLFLIRDNDIDNILFIGAYRQP